ncbi:PolC-type DNA polymerase III [Denitrificimonas caeni]|uniref:3'-5' exonuclease n=1 Tax=Denitrificimonas caeni TaxID=521720 RepID=A0AAE9VPQ8_9GAMM|nr:3'-5' exonuclease [Denitrificimonas caeni]WBE25868.1 3'-5' exonuclease [Denitrificimonas caeni]
MKIFKWFRKGPELRAKDALRLGALAAPVVSELPLHKQRFVVVDLETSGLNTLKDKILSIGAVTIEDSAIALGHQFSCTLRRQNLTVSESVLIHQIPPSEVAAGIRPEKALLSFMEYVGSSPLLAFHASFDQRMLVREMEDAFAYQLRHPFYDVAEIAPLLYPEHNMRNPGLDDWVDFFGLQVLQRHNASADAMVTAELMLILLKRAEQQGIEDLATLDISLQNWRRRQQSGL